MNKSLEVSLDELYALVGEREVLKYKLGVQLRQQEEQIFEMSQEITRLREERNRLASENQELRRIQNEREQDGA